MCTPICLRRRPNLDPHYDFVDIRRRIFQTAHKISHSPTKVAWWRMLMVMLMLMILQTVDPSLNLLDVAFYPQSVLQNRILQLDRG
mmetsp:Transcript_20582/g.58325  ORF Transcript_20582/g.58325 Transcript_20582/m.58325 type:complete len:86 (-) Transcript_20582:186-443(-)